MTIRVTETTTPAHVRTGHAAASQAEPFRPRDDAAHAAHQVRAQGHTFSEAPATLVILPNGRIPETGGERNMSYWAYGLHYLGVNTHIMLDPSPLATRLRADGVSVYNPPPVRVSADDAQLFYQEAMALGRLKEEAQTNLNLGKDVDTDALKRRAMVHISKLDELTTAPRHPLHDIVIEDPKAPLGWAYRALQIKRAVAATHSAVCLTDSQRDSIPAALALAGNPACHNLWYTQMTTAAPDAWIAHFSHITTCGLGVLANRFASAPWATAVPNGIDTSRFCDSLTTSVRPQDLRTAAFSIGNAAYFTPRKNQLALVQACGENAAALGDFRLFFFGATHYQPDKDGADYFEQVRQRGVILGIADRVHFLDSKPDLENYLPHLDVFVLPSKEEGLSLALLEAMSCGVPVIASDIAGNREMQGHGVTLFDPNVSQSLGNQLVHLAQNPDERQAQGREAAAHIRAAGYSTSGMLANMAKAVQQRAPEGHAAYWS